MVEARGITALYERSRDLRPTELERAPLIRRLPGTTAVSGQDPSLYPYQQEAAQLLAESGANLLVASATGSGKTRVIELAAQQAAALNLRLYVGEPLVALAEQIATRLAHDTGLGVELRTGPASALFGAIEEGPRPPVFIGTYEVLATLGHEQGYYPDAYALALDEFHFIASPRGPVLQEILHTAATQRLRLVALSGTLPNGPEVAGYLARLTQTETVILGAPSRPVPLSFQYLDVLLAPAALQLRPVARPPQPTVLRPATLGGIDDRQRLLAVARHLEQLDLLPCLLVAFSCRKLESWAADLAAIFPPLARGLRAHVHGRFQQLLRELDHEDHELVLPYLPLLERGLALHHSQLPYPYLELVCRLAEDRCLRICCCTSTLSAGINLPVRTVVLAGATLPDETGSFRELDPLLFHQLAGRAGRPGYETQGWVVLLGLGEAGYRSAQALTFTPLPAVRPHGLYDHGDVLRALRHGRMLPLERLVFEPHALQAIARQAQISERLAVDALRDLPDPQAFWALAAAARRLRCAPPRLRQLAALAPLIDHDRAGLEAGKEEAPRRGKPPRTTPIQELAAFLQLRGDSQALQVFLSSADAEARQRLAVVLNCAEDRAALASTPSFAAWDHILGELGPCVLPGPTPSALGLAAACVRASPLPHIALDIFLRGTLELPAARRVAALLVGSRGGARDPPGRPSYPWTADVTAALGDFQPTSVALVEATEAWAGGATLTMLRSTYDVPPGSFCRHIIRTVDLLVEVTTALQTLGCAAPGLVDAARPLVRGLPFRRRSRILAMAET